MLIIRNGEEKRGGAEMKNSVTRKQAAEALKISVPTLRKYLAKHREVMDGKYINILKLDDTITKESERSLSRQGK
jgi:hypothetical protein